MPFNCKTPGCHQVAAKSDGLCDLCHFVTKQELKEVVGSVNVRTQLVPVPTMVDPVVEANRKMLLDRSQVGLKKYGCGLQGIRTHRDILQHALEEALDLANYLQAEIMKIDAEAEAHKNTK